MSMDSGDASQLQRALAQSVREHWVLFLIEGIVLVVLGLLAIVIPPLATIAVTTELLAPVSSTRRNGPCPLMNTGAQMRPI